MVLSSAGTTVSVEVGGIQDFGGWESMVKQNPETGAVIVTMVNSSDGRGDVDQALEPFANE